jgi:hypothetical protein
VRPVVTDLDRELARLLIETFKPRLDVFAERLDDEEQVERLNKWMEDKAGPLAARRTWRVGDWKPCGAKGNRKPVTVEAIAEHCAGRRTLGFYPLHPDGTCNSVSVDFDNHRGTRTTERDPREDFDQLDGKVFRKSDPSARRLLAPLGHNCRCSCIELNEDDLAAGGYTVTNGRAAGYEPEPGWGADKVAALVPDALKRAA